MTIYEVMIFLYEGDNISMGLFRDHEDALQEYDACVEEWGGPNVESVMILERVVR